jgi:arabinofuranan 3-O-arabinosyltransferase
VGARVESVPRPRGSAPEQPAPATRAPRRWVRSGRLPHVAVALGLLLLNLVQQPGRTTFDTKLDLTVDPGGLLSGALHMWSSNSAFGGVANQAYGYLFPQGAFFALGELVGLPPWLTQRLWTTLVLVIAYEGARRLYRALVPEAGLATQMTAGLAFATAPRLLGLAGVLTGEVLPTAVLPWVVLPLVLTVQRRWSVLAGATLSGAAVLGMGGVNAVENLAAFPLPFLVLLWSVRRTRGPQLLAAWLGAVALASLWWLAPLLVFGRYSPPFLDYIEAAYATTGRLDWMNSVRGADHWVGFIWAGRGGWFPAAFELFNQPVLVAVTGVVAALGLLGLVHPRMPLRGPLLASVGLGLVCLTIGHTSPVGSPLAGTVQELLDGPLAPFRNVHKVDPLVRLPMALGLAFLVERLPAGVRWSGRLSRRLPAALGRQVRVVGGVVVAVLLVASATPLWQLEMRRPGWTDIPAPWREAASYLHDNAAGSRVLVLPGSGYADQNWGTTIDEPLQALDGVDWVSRTQIPLAPAETIRWLDAIEDRVGAGSGSQQLADVLARAGVGYILVRRDLDLLTTGATAPERVDQALGAGAGLTLVESFGRSGFGEQAMIDVFRIDREIQPVGMASADSAVRLWGGPEDVISAVEAGVLPASAPALIGARTRAATTHEPSVVADGYRRVERQYGRTQDAEGQLMSKDDRYRTTRSAPDYPGVPGIERSYRNHDTVAVMAASTSVGYADNFGVADSTRGTWAAVDGDPKTFWESGPYTSATDQWLSMRLREPTPLETLSVTVNTRAPAAEIRKLRIEAAGRTWHVGVDPETGVAGVDVQGRTVTGVRVAVEAAGGQRPDGPVRISEVAWRGMSQAQRVVVPARDVDAGSSLVFRADPTRTACILTFGGTVCDSRQVKRRESGLEISRRVQIDTPGTWLLSGTALAQPTPAAWELLDPLPGRVRVRADSVYADEPLVAGVAAYDGDVGTTWLSDPNGSSPTLRLSWDRPRTLDRLGVIGPSGTGRAPTRALLQTDQGTRAVEFGRNRLGYFEPARTRHLDITFGAGNAGQGSEPIGVAELRIHGLRKLRYSPASDSAIGVVCGFGPEIQIDGVRYPTRVTSTRTQFTRGLPMTVEPCGPPPRLQPGNHDIRMSENGQFSPLSLTMRSQRPAASAVSPRSTEVRAWTDGDRTVRVGAGPASLLWMHENTNPGWEATLDGRRLTPRVVDGWQQGFEVPSGAGGDVRIRFAPQSSYVASLASGLGAAILLLLLAVVAFRWRRRWLLGVDPAPLRRPQSPGVVTAAVLVLAAWPLAGPAVAAGLALGLLVPRARSLGRHTRAVTGAVTIALAVLGAAVSAQLGGSPQPTWASLLAGLGVGVLVAAALDLHPSPLRGRSAR